MALSIKHIKESKEGKPIETEFGVGDTVRVYTEVKEGEKTRQQAFEGMVIKIRGREENKTFTVRRIGTQQIGIERIFPLNSPVIDRVEVVKKGLAGVRRAKLYYTRDKAKKEIEAIYSKANRKNQPVKKNPAKKKTAKKSAK